MPRYSQTSFRKVSFVLLDAGICCHHVGKACKQALLFHMEAQGKCCSAWPGPLHSGCSQGKALTLYFGNLKANAQADWTNHLREHTCILSEAVLVSMLNDTCLQQPMICRDASWTKRPCSSCQSSCRQSCLQALARCWPSRFKQVLCQPAQGLLKALQAAPTFR